MKNNSENGNVRLDAINEGGMEPNDILKRADQSIKKMHTNNEQENVLQVIAAIKNERAYVVAIYQKRFLYRWTEMSMKLVEDMMLKIAFGAPTTIFFPLSSLPQ